MPPDYVFAIGSTGVVAEKTGAAMKKYNQVWHEQVKQANQATHWSKQQAEYVQELGHTHEQTTRHEQQL